MRDAFCQSLCAIAEKPELVFLTGDLGYKALEPLREMMGPRFINAGVAEQNMVSVAAGLARSGLRPWVYSIAPFVYARPFEQIRNDVCLHDLPVVLVGNGGGYGYGVMGATHHAIEDYGALLCLPHLRAYVPAFDEDVSAVASLLMQTPHPAYLRLGYAQGPVGVAVPEYAPWRKLLSGAREVIVAAGPLVGPIWAAALQLDEGERPDIWLVSELPLDELPEQFISDVRRAERVLVVEEHVSQGGLGQMLAHRMLTNSLAPREFRTCHAAGYPTGRYGSQRFHREQSGLDPDTVLRHYRRGMVSHV